MSDLNEEAVQQALRSGIFTSREEVVNHIQALTKMRENSLIEAVARGDMMGACKLVYPTLLCLRRMAGKHEPPDLSSFRFRGDD